MSRVLQVCAVDFTAYHMLRPLLLASEAVGLNAEFACADGPWAARLREEGLAFRPVPMTRAVSPARQMGAVLALARSLRADPPDLVHTHTPVGGFVGRAAALTWSGPVVHTFHGLPVQPGAASATDALFLWTERILARRTTFFLSQAKGDLSRAAALGIARLNDGLVIGNGVDVSRFAPDPDVRFSMRATLGLREDDVAVLTVARLVREKGLIDLADAALRLAHDGRLQFLIAGEALPSDRTGISHELHAHPVARQLRHRWRLLGHRADVERLLQAADLFVLPSHREGLPRSVIEAMAVGLPVIATDIPACRELVRTDTGMLVPIASPEALAEAIASLSADPQARAAMGACARDVALADHDERDVLRRQLTVYRRLLSG